MLKDLHINFFSSVMQGFNEDKTDKSVQVGI